MARDRAQRESSHWFSLVSIYQTDVRQFFRFSNMICPLDLVRDLGLGSGLGLGLGSVLESGLGSFSKFLLTVVW